MNRISEDPAYGRLKAHLIALTGLSFYAQRDVLLTSVIDGRLTGRGLRDCASYAALLADGKKGEAELEGLIAQLTIGETSFFRDEAAFAGIRETILPEILERNAGAKQIKIWSAGCSTGAEPYSLAILLSQQFAQRARGWQVEIQATDLNRDSLARAVEGKFRKWALRCTPDAVRQACFSNEGLVWTIHPRYKQWISFQHMNLVEAAFATPWPSDTRFDLILCRNVMIYFSPEARRRLISQLHRSLKDSGWLVVGASEQSLVNYKAFRTVQQAGVAFYQRAPISQTMTEKLEEPVALSARLPEPVADQTAEPGPTDLERLKDLADRGEWQLAAECSQSMLHSDPLNPSVHYYRALIFESLGIDGQSERSLRQAIYLDRNFAMAHYRLGLVLKRQQEMIAAARCFGNVLNVLAGKPAKAIMAGGSVTVAGLAELARNELGTSSGA